MQTWHVEADGVLTPHELAKYPEDVKAEPGYIRSRAKSKWLTQNRPELQREAKFKPGVDTECYLTKDNPIDFKDHEILVTKQTANVTRITFKNVPFNVPDEEILNLCSCYGDIGDSRVSYEKPTVNSRRVMGATRFVDLKLKTRQARATR